MLIRAGEQHRVANRSEEALLRLIVIGITVQRCPFQLSKESADGLYTSSSSGQEPQD